MKYMPISPATVRRIVVGSHVYADNRKWVVIERRQSVYTVCNNDVAKVLSPNELLDYYAAATILLSTNELASDKFAEFMVDDPYSETPLPTHAEMNERLTEEKQLLPMHDKMLSSLSVGQTVYYNGGHEPHRGKRGRITALDVDHNHSTDDPGLEVWWDGVSSDCIYSNGWFANNVYLKVDDILQFRKFNGKAFVKKYNDHIKNPSHLAAYKLANHKTIKAEVEAKKRKLSDIVKEWLPSHEESKPHSFDTTQSKGKWVAVDAESTDILMAETEPGLKAALALILAQHPDAKYNIFHQVGTAENKPQLTFTSL